MAISRANCMHFAEYTRNTENAYYLDFAEYHCMILWNDLILWNNSILQNNLILGKTRFSGIPGFCVGPDLTQNTIRYLHSSSLACDQCTIYH